MTITIEQIKEVFYADFENGRLYRKSTNKETGSVCRVGRNGESYLRTSFKGKQLYVHRVIYALAHGEWPQGIDHENGNTMCNRLSNLKAGSQKENMKNRASFRNESKYGRGIRLHIRDGQPYRYCCTVLCDGERHYRSFPLDQLLEAQIWMVNKYLELDFSDRHVEGLIQKIQDNPEYQTWNPMLRTIH